MNNYYNDEQHPFRVIGLTLGSILPRMVITSAAFAAASVIPLSENGLPKITTKTAAITGALVGSVLGISHAGKIIDENRMALNNTERA